MLCQQRDGAQQRGEGRCHDDDLPLAPTTHFQMMVEGCHLEKALAVGQLEITHLNDDRQGLKNIHQTHGNQDQRHIIGKSQRCHGTTQDMVQAMDYLVNAKFVTGQVLPVNGGMVL